MGTIYAGSAAVAALAVPPVGCRLRSKPPKVPLAPAVFNPLQDALKKSYLDLFEQAPGLEFSSAQAEKMREYLENAQDFCVGKFKNRAKQHDDAIRAAQARL